MKKNLTELVFILDRSGSMSGLEADTVGGFNSMIKKQKKEIVRGLTVLFSAFMVIGRLIAGVHWFTDIVGAVILSTGLYCLYKAMALLFCDDK